MSDHMMPPTIDNGVRIDISDILVMEISDHTDMPMPLIALYFLPTNGAPGFSVGIPLAIWPDVVRAMGKFEPRLKRA